MTGLPRNRRGLSQVVTTLILLVVSVLLATIVAYYATNITMTRTRQEEVELVYVHVWVDRTGNASAAFKIKNVGSLDILLDEIAVRGVECEWTNVWYNESVNIPIGDLSWKDMTNSTGNVFFDVHASKDIPLESSGVIAVYIRDPPNIELTDVGTTVSLTVYTMHGQWIEEVNVELGK